MAREDPERPFAVLGMAPTLDPAAVKRAWFEALRRHPPHADPEGFRKIRAAYEALLAPGALVVAYMAAPHDPAATFATYESWFGPRLAEATTGLLHESSQAEQLARFEATVPALAWDEILAGKVEPGRS